MITSLRNVGVSSALGANEESDKERMEQHPNVVTALKVDGAVFLMSSSMRLAPGLVTSILYRSSDIPGRA